MPKITILLAALLSCGLALPSARAADPDAPEWQVPDVTKVAVELADVAEAEADAPLPPTDRFVATLTADGRMHFGSAARYVAGGGDMGAGPLSLTEGRKTHETLQAFKGALRTVVGKPGMRAGNGMARLRLLVRADRSLPWVEALWLMEAAAAPDVGIYRTQFAVRKTGASTGTSWRLPYDFPLDDARTEQPTHECFVRIDFDQTTEGRRVLGILEGFDASGGSVRRRLAELPVDAERGLDLAALTKALHAYRGVHGRGGVPALLVTTLALTPRGARAWTFGNVLPVLASLRELGVRVLFQDAPPDLLPSPSSVPYDGARTPFGGPPPRVTRRTGRWEKAIDEALRWLTAHQSPNGAWEAAGFGAWCDGKPAAGKGPTGKGSADHDVGVTGLALLAFLGAGYTPRGEHPYVETVRRGLDYLRGVQDEEGCFGSRVGKQWVYDHGAATWAMVEAYGLTESPDLQASAQGGLDFVATCRNPYFAWRYGMKPGDNDTSVTGWMLMPLALARIVNEDRKGRGQQPALILDEEAFDGVRAWLEKMTDVDYGRTGYIQRGGSPARPQALIDRFPSDKSEAITALGITLRVFSGEDPTRARLILRGLELLKSLPPVWIPNDGSIDMYYWYWGSLATFQAGRRTWKVWKDALDKAVVSNQRKDTTYCFYRGSWDPIGPWGRTGGRVYSTALLALALETPTRYARRFGR